LEGAEAAASGGGGQSDVGKIGLGIGLGIGVAGLIVGVIAMRYWRKTRAAAATVAAATSVPKSELSLEYGCALKERQPAELYTEQRPVELYTEQQPRELCGVGVPAEMYASSKW
jgi:hypothetical protein